MITRNFVPFLLILFGTTSSFPSMFYGTSLQNKIKIAANELGIPEWKVWDTWLQFRTCTVCGKQVVRNKFFGLYL